MRSDAESSPAKGVTVLFEYMVTLKERTGRRQESAVFPAGSVIKDVVEWLKERYGISLPDPQIMAVYNNRGLNQLPQELGTQLQEGDTICLFPPLSGG